MVPLPLLHALRASNGLLSRTFQPISDAQLAAFTAYYADDPSFAAGKGNNRVTQPLNNRIVYFASGLGATATGGDIAIPWDAWLSWGVGGAIMLFVIGAIIW